MSTRNANKRYRRLLWTADRIEENILKQVAQHGVESFKRMMDDQEGSYKVD